MTSARTPKPVHWTAAELAVLRPLVLKAVPALTWKEVGALEAAMGQIIEATRRLLKATRRKQGRSKCQRPRGSAKTKRAR